MSRIRIGAWCHMYLETFLFTSSSRSSGSWFQFSLKKRCQLAWPVSLENRPFCVEGALHADVCVAGNFTFASLVTTGGAEKGLSHKETSTFHDVLVSSPLHRTETRWNAMTAFALQAEVETHSSLPEPPVPKPCSHLLRKQQAKLWLSYKPGRCWRPSSSLCTCWLGTGNHPGAQQSSYLQLAAEAGAGFLPSPAQQVALAAMFTREGVSQLYIWLPEWLSRKRGSKVGLGLEYIICYCELD